METIKNLLKLKSIVTLIVVISYTKMVFMGIVEPDYKDLVIMILTYYFAKVSDKKESEKHGL